MKKIIFTLGLSIPLFSNFNLNAQNWVNGGNNFSADGRLGLISSHSLIFITNNSERGRVSYNGYWGFGTSSPSAKVHINSPSGVSPLRVAVNGSTKLFVHYGGGVSVGAGNTPPSNGLYVAGNLGIGTSSPSYKLQVNGNASIANGLYVANKGVYGYNSGGPGVYGSGSTSGVYGTSTGTYGVYAKGGTYGVYGSGNSYGVYGFSSNGYGTSGYSTNSYGLYGYNNTNSYGVVAYGGYGGVYGSGGTIGVYGTGRLYGVWGYSSGGYGVYGQSSSNYGVYGSSTSYPGVYAYSGSHYGIEAHNNSGNWAATAYGGYGGVYGTGGSYGVYGSTTNGLGGYFYSANSYGIRAATGRSDKNWAGVFDGNVYSYGAYQTSDKNLKKNIEDFSDAISIINKLKPRSYEFRNDGKLALMNLPQGKHYGLIAQELEQVMPNLVKEVEGDISSAKPDPKPTPKPGMITTSALDPKSPIKMSNQTGAQQTAEQNIAGEKMTIKSVNYIELIPVMIKAIQEQQVKIDALTQLVNQLQHSTPEASVKLSGISLGQNEPNPAVANSTRINYYLPSGTSTAALILTNSAGQKIKEFRLNNSGLVDINTSLLSSGTYYYTLYVDGRAFETKKMIINR